MPGTCYVMTAVKRMHAPSTVTTRRAMLIIPLIFAGPLTNSTSRQAYALNSPEAKGHSPLPPTPLARCRVISNKAHMKSKCGRDGGRGGGKREKERARRNNKTENHFMYTVSPRNIGTGVPKAGVLVHMFSYAAKGGRRPSSIFRQGN